MSSVRVAVRVRPLNKREKQLSSKVIVYTKGNSTSIQKPSPVRGDKLVDRGTAFSYDFSYDSTDRRNPMFASQEKIFHDLGSGVLKAAFEGFNTCVFAYGQTGSGKSYTMMGNANDRGLIPRICEGLFCEIAHRSKTDTVSFSTEVSYLEIYNENVQDLLREGATPTDGGGLRVREHPVDGPYVENLSRHQVNNHKNLEDLIVVGNANRTTASTGMNDSSSRSHAIFTIRFTQAWIDVALPRETLSKIHLVDLAGSERADATRATGTRLREGANINKSLVTLGSVISALADLSVAGQSARKKKQIFIPYRDSVLTWLLKDSLGGNSMTTMIATVSPADVNYTETLSTLRYASRAKNIVNSPTVNEDSSVKVISELQAEVTRLRMLLQEANQVSRGELFSSGKIEEELHQNEEKVQALTKQWSSKWAETQSILQEQTIALRKEGSGVVLDCHLPHLIGVDGDLLGTGINLYYLKEGRTLIGSDEASCVRDIVLQGPGILGEHCVVENRAGTVTLIPQDGALCSVNGTVVTEPCQLTQGAVTQLGRGTVLRFNHPTEAAKLREKRQRGSPAAVSLHLTDMSKSTENLSDGMLLDPGQMNVQAAQTAESSSCLTSVERLISGAIPGKYPVPHPHFELDGDALRGGVSTRDGQEQERDQCHKSAPGLMSEWPQRGAQSRDAAASYKEEQVWSGDASLQQTSVLGPGDGCGEKPEGDANEIQGVVADCYEGRPGSGGNSLGSRSPPQSTRETSSTSVLPQTSARSSLHEKPLNRQAARCPPEEKACEGQVVCGEMDEAVGLEEIPGVCVKDAAAAVQSSGLRSLFTRVTLIVQDAGRLLWSSPTVLQQVREEGLQPVGARWSSHVVSLVRDSKVLSVVKESQVLSVMKGSFVFSMLRDSHIFSMVTKLPLVQHIQMEITQNLTPCSDIWTGPENIRDLPSPPEQDITAVDVRQEDTPISELVPVKHISEPEVSNASKDENQAVESSEAPQNKPAVKIMCQTLTGFPESLLSLQTLSLSDLMDTLRSLTPTSLLTSQRIVALFWMNVAKCSLPEPRPALLVLLDTGLYTLTSDSGLLTLFHHLPLLQLKEVQINLAGHSLRLMGSTEESILAVYTHSQRLSKELCWAIFGIICPGDNRVLHHPLFSGDLMQMSLDLDMYVPDLLLDAGLRVCSQFQRSIADLLYLIICNMDPTTVCLGEVQLLLYTSVEVRVSPSVCTEPLVHLFLTHTHLGLVQEDAVFHPAPCAVSVAPRHPQFHHLTLRQRSDVRCVMVHDEDECGAVTLDVVLANMRGRGHPESQTKTATPPVQASNSSPHAEVWKLTFSCSSEAACLINHLSNV